MGISAFLCGIKEKAKEVIKKCKLQVIIFAIVFLLALLVAILNVIKIYDYLSLYSLTDKLLILYLKEDMKLFVLIFLYFFQYVILIGLCFLLNCNKYLRIINYFVFFVLSFNVVFNLIVMICLFNICGIFYVIFIGIVCDIIFLLIYLFSSICFIDYLNNVTSENYFKNIVCIKNILIFVPVVVVLICLVKTIFLPFVTSILIIAK